MAGNIKGITIEFRGDTTKLDKALREINNETRSIDKELKQVDNALKFNPTSVELWRQKQQLLTQKIDETKTKLDVLKQAQTQMDASGVDKTSQEYRNLQREIIETESKAKKFENQLRQIGNANLKALSKQLEDIGGKMTSVGKSMTTNVTAPIVAGYTLATKYASDYEENLNKIDVAFGDNSQAVKDWANAASEEFGLSKVQATDAASAFGALGKGIGLSESEAAGMATTLAGLSADLGSYFNVGVDESAKALEGIFTGESEALKKFGVVMNDTNLQKFAEDQGLVWKEMDQSQKTMLRYQYVLTMTKDAQGDFSRTSDGTANSTKIFQASLQDLGTTIGTTLLPIITPIIQKITEWVNKFNELSPTTQRIITIIGLVVAAAGPLIMIIGTLITSIGAIIGALGMVTAPMLGIVAVIAAVIAAGVFLFKHWDQIKAAAVSLGNKISDVWNNIKSATSRAWEAVKNAIVSPFQWAKDKISSIIDSIRNFFPVHLGNLFKGIKLPHFNIEWSSISFGDTTIDFPSGFDIEWYKKGGIFNSASLIGVGEAGPEAVVPLNKFWDKLDNMAAASAAPVINIYPGPNQSAREIAKEVERVLVQQQKQRAQAYGTI